MLYPAHIRITDCKERLIQSVKEHSEATASFAAKCLEPAHLNRTGYLAGLIHDMGKLQHLFSDYITKATDGESVRKGSVIHTFQGCRLLLEKYHFSSADLASELIAYAVAAHHGQFDCVGEQSDEHGFDHRIKKQRVGYEEAKEGFFEICHGEDNLDALYGEAQQELSKVIDTIRNLAMESAQNKANESLEDIDYQRVIEDVNFYAGLTARLLLSSVIEGDRRDTAAFMNDTVYPVFSGYEDLGAFWGGLLERMEGRLQKFGNQTPIQKARGKISDICKQASSNSTGIYRLNVPTGAGKTLSSLRFALAHAASNKKRKIIFTAPLLSIIDQNAQVIREYLGDDSIILEHHTNIGDTLAENIADPPGAEENEETNTAPEELRNQELLAESWDAPVIITSMVQLLHTLFGGRTANIRRFQALCGSVIIVDEVQSVPGKMISLFNLAVNFLSRVCDVTFVLCSATQPYLEGVKHALFPEPMDLVPYDEKLWEPFRRTCIVESPAMRLEQIPSFVSSQMTETSSLLVVCNKKSEAEFLFGALKEEWEFCYHLSASMCMKHRKDTLLDLVKVLEESREGRKKVICISTQVIEAGVDISFGRVIRFEAGMDSVVQAAGRCNRNGEEPGQAPVFIVDCMDEKLGRLKEIRDGKIALKGLLQAFGEMPDYFGGNLASAEAVQCYYRKLYDGMPEGYQDFAVEGKGRSIFSMLSENRGYRQGVRKNQDAYTLNQAFAKAGTVFQVFDDQSEDIVVPYGDGELLLAELEEKYDSGYVPQGFMMDWIKRAKPYTVSIYNYQKEALEKKAGIYELNGVMILRKDFYDLKTGVFNDNENNGFIEI